ncbi:MAG: hypothetical protein GW949_09220 [Spirochaetales bacterium]|nr:hypothetical protein [Spirochaetales bacterium]
MYFHKVDTPYNFLFTQAGERESTEVARPLLPSGEEFVVSLLPQGHDSFRYSVTSSKRWPQGNPSQAVLSTDEFHSVPSRVSGQIKPDGSVEFSWDGKILLSSLGQKGFGVNGTHWMLCFPYKPHQRFYGMGEKKGFERTGKRTQFWNTDVFGDFAPGLIETADTDPMYASFPVLIIRLEEGNQTPAGLETQGYRYAGIVINNPDAVFMNIAAEEGIFAFQGIPPEPVWYFGSRNWEPEVYFFFSEDLPSMVRKIQNLQGRVALPPLWALGHHQSRWGYRSADQLETLEMKFRELEIPNDALWLDIEYMRGYRIFTINDEAFPDLEKTLDDLRQKGIRVVPILDPGIKLDPDWDVYTDGKTHNIYARNTEGEDFCGFVWPGVTVFPDFSQGEVRNWWAKKVTEFAKRGFAGFWIDMNDPSTGSAPLEDMRFDSGLLEHGAYHNQYAMGMASATRRGLELAGEGRRPFLLSRSAFLSSGRYTALWTGDNVSNVHHLANGITLALSLSLSGMPFIGPDVPGFGGNASAELMRAWYKAGFLFPFFRNHNILSAQDQEPWTRDAKTTEIVTEYIRLRYKFLPYLYNLFIDQEDHGDPILRPILYHDDSEAATRIEDQFLVGPYIMQAPILSETDFGRKVYVPRGSWYSILREQWITGPTEIDVETKAETTPLYFLEGGILPLQTGIRKSNQNDLSRLELLLLWHPGLKESTTLRYRFDDGETNEYRRGIRSEVEIILHPGQNPRVQITGRRMAAGPMNVTLLFLGTHRLADVEVDGIRSPVSLDLSTLRIGGRNLKVTVSRYWNVGVKQG